MAPLHLPAAAHMFLPPLSVIPRPFRSCSVVWFGWSVQWLSSDMYAAGELSWTFRARGRLLQDDICCSCYAGWSSPKVGPSLKSSLTFVQYSPVLPSRAEWRTTSNATARAVQWWERPLAVLMLLRNGGNARWLSSCLTCLQWLLGRRTHGWPTLFAQGLVSVPSGLRWD